MELKRLEQQIRFIVEIDKLKTVRRRTYVIDEHRSENTAEHSWHIAVMAMILAEYANEKIDVTKVVKMALVHDIVEIDAGDTFMYDTVGALDKAEREQRAAERIFNLLPPDQAVEMRALWEEFEARQSAEARFAAAMDRLTPQLQNFNTNGGSWKDHAISRERVIDRNRTMGEGSADLWEFTQRLLDRAVEKGILTKSRDSA
jgi:putative hydrolase of HD superfamily